MTATAAEAAPARAALLQRQTPPCAVHSHSLLLASVSNGSHAREKHEYPIDRNFLYRVLFARAYSRASAP